MTRGPTRRYSLNYDFIYGKGNQPCWRCGKINKEKICDKCKNNLK